MQLTVPPAPNVDFADEYSDLDAAWQIVAFALGKSPNDAGRPVFDAWLKSMPYIDLPILRQACEALAERQEASSYITINLSTIKAEYLKRRDATARVSHCPHCLGTSFVYAIVAGDSPDQNELIERHHIAPYPVVYETMLYCRCARGQAKELKATGKQPDWQSDRRNWVWDNCVFATPHDCNAVFRKIKAARERASA